MRMDLEESIQKYNKLNVIVRRRFGENITAEILLGIG